MTSSSAETFPLYPEKKCGIYRCGRHASGFSAESGKIYPYQIGGAMAEKRSTGRHRKRYTIRFGVGSATRIAFTEDISAVGMFIKTANVVPIDTNIMIELTTQQNEVVSFEGVVRWSKKVPQNMVHMVNKSGMGVKITRFIAGEAIYRQLIDDLQARSGG
jgi:hypothetical protein